MSATAVRIPLADATARAEKIAGALRHIGAIVYVVGSVRRQELDVGDLDFVVIHDTAPLPRLCRLAGIAVQTYGDRRVIGTAEGCSVNVWRTDVECLGAALFKFTGPVGYVIGYVTRAKKAGRKLSEAGLFDAAGRRIAGATEDSIYAAFDKPWRPPEERGSPDTLTAIARRVTKGAR